MIELEHLHGGTNDTVLFWPGGVYADIKQPGADEQELATPILSLKYVTAFLQTDLFLVHPFFCERKAVLVQ